MSKYIQTPERVKSCLKACEDFADPVSAVRDNFAFGTDMANTVNRLRAINADLLLALEYLIQGQPGEAQFDRLYDVKVSVAHDAIARAKREAA